MRRFLERLIFRRLSTKLTILILTLLFVFMSLISYLYYGSSARLIGENVRASTKLAAKQAADYLTLMLAIGSDVASQISRDQQIQRVIRIEQQGNMTVDQKYEMNETVNAILNNIMYTSSFVRSIYLLKEEGSSWGSGVLNFDKVKRYTLAEHDWYQAVTEGGASELWLPLRYDPFSGGGENTELVMSLVKPYRDVATGETLGVILVNIKGKLLLDSIERIRLGKTGKFYVVDAAGTPMIGSPAEYGGPLAHEDGRDEYRMNVDGVPYYFVTRKMENGWMVVGAVPVREIVEDIAGLQRQIWLYASVLLLIASAVGVLFSRRITSPLHELMRQMRQLEQSDFTAQLHVRSKDEIGLLGARFNQMVRRIERLMAQINRVESGKREAEMRALRHQINPHFLYNTLSTIRWMIKLKNYDGAYKSISSLVKLMEAGMEKKGPFNTIGSELDLLEKYMDIQRFRYGQQLVLNVECEEDLKPLSVPRMLLQPIVENAIFHGIGPKDGAGTINVRIARDPADSAVLLISVEDDGVGLDPGRADALLARGEKRKSGMFGIGLRHVHETIQLYYGTGSGVKLDSEAGKGTKVTLILDARGKGDHGIQSRAGG